MIRILALFVLFVSPLSTFAQGFNDEIKVGDQISCEVRFAVLTSGSLGKWIQPKNGCMQTQVVEKESCDEEGCFNVKSAELTIENEGFRSEFTLNDRWASLLTSAGGHASVANMHALTLLEPGMALLNIDTTKSPVVYRGEKVSYISFVCSARQACGE